VVINRPCACQIYLKTIKNTNISLSVLEKSKCEYEREKAIAYNYRNAEGPYGAVFVPECTPYGNYKKLQWLINDGTAWCVDEFTGDEIQGTRTQAHAEQLPSCPGKCDQE